MKIKYLISLALLIALIYGLNYGITYAHIGAAYNAKMACSCVFVSGRSLESVEKEDLYAIPFARQTVDQEHKTVTSSIYGISKTAIFRPGLGCTIENDKSEKELTTQWQGIDLSLGSDLELPIDTAVNQSTLSQINKTFDWAFDDSDTSHIVRTRAALVLHNGEVVAERYAHGFNQNTPLMGWSMTKSVTNAMIGILVQDHKLDIHKTGIVKEWLHDDRKNITIDHLLRMSSGLDFEEVYTKVSDATKMLFLECGAGSFAMHSKAKYAPDTKWYYSSGATNILQEIIKRSFTNTQDYIKFPHERLFDKLGMQSAIMEPDACGTYVGSSYMFATARDWAKFGQLYLDDGLHNGERILPEGWVKYSSTVTPASDGEYAAHFWTGLRKKGLSGDCFMMDGFEGQYVLIIPSKKLVIVRLGCTPAPHHFDMGKFSKEIVDLF
ncbi:MAG: serine hydrolase [Saprospiraceae bacterium]